MNSVKTCLRVRIRTADLSKCESGVTNPRFPPRRPGFKPGSGHVGFCNGQKWRGGRFSPRTSVSPANVHSICLSTIIFTITRGWDNRPGVAAVPIASQTRIKKKHRYRYQLRIKRWVGSATRINLTWLVGLCELWLGKDRN
jgi:hypothetical protein